MQNKKILVIFIVAIFLAAFGLVYFLITKNLSLVNVAKNKNLNSKVEKENICKYSSDDESVNNAVGSVNPEICDCVKNSDLKKSCFDYLDVELFSKGVSALDVELCGKIKDNEKKRLCEVDVDSGLKLASIENEKSIAETYVLISNSENIDKYEKLIKAYPENKEYFLQLALAYSGKSIKDREFEKDLRDRIYFNRALDTLNQSEKMFENKAQFYRIKGFVYFENFKFEEAEKYLNESIKVSPNKAYLHLMLSQILYQQGRDNSTIESAQRGLDILDNASGISEVEKNNLKVYFYSVLTGVYHQQNDSDNEEKYKKMVSDLMSIIKNN